MKITQEATKVHLELFIGLFQLDFVENLICAQRFLHIENRLNTDHALVFDIQHSVKLLNNTLLLIIQFEAELCQHSQELLHFNQASFVFHRVSS